MTRAFAILALTLTACGPRQPDPAPVLVEIPTYLATPARGSAIDAAAARACRDRSRRAVFRATRGDGRGGFRHTYACVP